jgi:hypothetical protein
MQVICSCKEPEIQIDTGETTAFDGVKTAKLKFECHPYCKKCGNIIHKYKGGQHGER